MEKAKKWSSVHLGEDGHIASVDVVSASDYDDLYTRWENQKASLERNHETIVNLKREMAIANSSLEDQRNATLEKLRVAQCVNSQLRRRLAVAVATIPGEARDLSVDLLQSQVAHLKETLAEERASKPASDIERRLSLIEERMLAFPLFPKMSLDRPRELSLSAKIEQIRKVLDR